MTANGEVQTNEEAQVYDRDLGSLRDSTDLRGYVSSSIAGKTLRRSLDISSHLKMQ